LNDSRHVGLSVYNVAIMCICGAAVALVLVDHQDALFLIIGVFVLFCTTATLWLVFVPKMLELRRNPGGSIDKRIRATLRPMSKTRRDSSVSELETKLKDVKALNSKYRKTLLDKESELQVIVCDWGASVSSVFLPSDVDQAVGQRGQGNTRLEDGLDERHQQTVGAAAAEGGPQCHRD
jgi:hypothetical protein